MIRKEELLALADEKPNSINDDLYAWATQAAAALREYAGTLGTVQKLRPDFLAGYDAGMADAKRMAENDQLLQEPQRLPTMEQEPVAWRLLTKQWPTIQDEDYRYIPHVHGMTQNDGWLPLYASPPAPTTPQSASVFGGSYQADGYIISRFTTTAGAERVLFEFKEPKGMLHIFTPEEIKVKP